MNVNPFDKKARVRDYLYNTKRRQEILSKVNNDEMLNELDKNVLARYNKKIAELDKCASEKEQHIRDIDNGCWQNKNIKICISKPKACEHLWCSNVSKLVVNLC